MKLTRYEQETVVNYNSGEKNATIYTRDRAVMRKLDRLVVHFPEIYRQIGQDGISKTYLCPKEYISYRKPRKVSKEQREKARQMMIAKNKARQVK